MLRTLPALRLLRLLRLQRTLPALTASLLLLAAGPVFAVAGGGGGGGFDSGGGDGGEIIVELMLWIILSLPFPWNLIVLAVIGGGLWFGGKNARASSGLNRVRSPGQVTAMIETVDPAFLHRNPAFQLEVFQAKVNTAFLAIQDAWMRQDLAGVRRWISDGVWQRFNTQFALMRLLGQTNRVSNIVVRRIFIDRIEQDGAYDVVQVGIHYTANDDFVSAKYPELDQQGPLELVEFWSFIRRAGVAEKDLYQTNHCPNCGAELAADLGEVARCGACGAVSTLGDYDWILAEITQADDYANQNTRLAKAGGLTRRIRAALAADGEFSVQWLEDKASNAYLQMLAAQVLRQPERMRRFVGDALFAQLAARIASAPPLAFNRLYLNNVTLIDHFRQAGQDHLVVAVKYSAQRVDISGPRLRLIDPALYASDQIMILARDVGAARAKGSLYAHACPNCGAPLADTLEIKCGYCASVLNSTRHEWIVTRLLAAADYRTLTVDAAAPPVLATGLRLTPLDPAFAARDYAFNNVLVILGADGAISIEEANFAQQLARRMGYDAKKLAGMLELARQRQLPLRLPEDRKTAEKVLRLMSEAAAADKTISPEERAMLDQLQRRITTLAALAA